MTDKKEIAVIPYEAQAGEMMKLAIEKGSSVETIEKLMGVRRELRQEFIQSEFNRAMAGFQGECPVIKKTKKVMNKAEKGGGLRYAYAPLDVIVEQVGSIIAKHGLSYTITAETKDSKVTATVKVTHEAGWSQTSSFEVEIDPSAFMNKPQQFASALTFAKRYAFSNAFGILTGDEDNDAKGADKVAPKKASMSSEEIMKNSMLMINACKSLKALDEMLERVNKAKTLTPAEKTALIDAIAIKNVELTKTDAPVAGK